VKRIAESQARAYAGSLISHVHAKRGRLIRDLLKTNHEVLIFAHVPKEEKPYRGIFDINLTDGLEYPIAQKFKERNGNEMGNRRSVNIPEKNFKYSLEIKTRLFAKHPRSISLFCLIFPSSLRAVPFNSATRFITSGNNIDNSHFLGLILTMENSAKLH
jgi:hypothetical protein